MSAYFNDISKTAGSSSGLAEKKSDESIPVDGYQQVLEMLKIADPAFRDSLLRRIAQRDRNLAHDLRQQIGV